MRVAQPTDSVYSRVQSPPKQSHTETVEAKPHRNKWSTTLSTENTRTGEHEVGTGYFDPITTALNPGSATLALVGSTGEPIPLIILSLVE